MKRIIAAAALATPMAAAASPVEYLGLQYSQVNVDHDDINGDVEPDAAVFRAGTRYTDRFALEGRVGTGVSDDKVGGVSYEVDHLFGIYAVGLVPLGSADVYALAGGSSTNVEGSAGGAKESASETGFSYGAGVDFYPIDNVGLNAEWTSYLHDDEYDATAFSAGVTLLFR